MIKKQVLFFILSSCLSCLCIIGRLNNWPGNDKLIFLSVILLLFVTIIIGIKTTRLKFWNIVLGIFWIFITISAVGISYRILNFSASQWPIKIFAPEIRTIQTTYKSFNWAISSPEKVKLKQQVIDNMLINKLQNLEYLYSLLVIKNDTLVTEKYFRGTNKSTAFNIASATKTFTGVLTGIAIQKGFITSDSTKIKSLIPHYFTSSTEQLKRNITIKHLLSMQAGWDNNNRINERGFNWVASSMSNKLSFKPGSAFLYSDIEPHILVNIIEHQSHTEIQNFAQKYLCDKLNITIADWKKTPNGQHYGMGSIVMTARDMARFGQLFIKNGCIDGQNIVDSTWIAKMTTNYVKKNLMPDNVPSKKYGYLIWLDNYANRDIFLAAGAGGQLIMIVPYLNIILVTTAKTDLPPHKLADNALHIQKVLTDFVKFEIDSK
jgi:CubicO group peptidase (beta-lactamase class C family)